MRAALKAVVVASAAALAAGAFATATGTAASAYAVAPQPTTAPATASVPVASNCSVATKPGTVGCMSERRTDVASPHTLSPNVTPSGYGPADLRSAYLAPSTAGSGTTIAIVDAYDNPNAESDLATYRAQYGLTPCTTANGCFRKVNQAGAASPLPSADTGWAGEISLDLDMVSAISPNSHIILVEANSNNDVDLYTAINSAVALGAKYISNSWGGPEDASQTQTDANYLNHPGVVITASTGDSGYGTEFPAASQYVTAVGGTSLRRASTSRGWTESAWSGAGSGCSAYDSKPSWQTVSTGCAKRAAADVSAVADPATGVAVYQTYGGSGWMVYGGTSAASPIVASMYALAGAPGTNDYPASYPYSHQANLFDVTSGSNGSCGAPLCQSGTGWDGPTGLGTPNGVTAFKPGTGTTSPVSVTNPGSQTSTAGTAVSLTMRASGGTGGYTWSATGLPAGLSLSSSTGVVSGTPTTSSVSSVTVTATDTSGATASASFSWTVNPAVTSTCPAGNLFGNPGFETGAATPWTATAGVPSKTGTGEVAHTGTWFAWLDGYGKTHTDTLTQTVTIPAGCSKASLSFWLRIDTAETTKTAAYDKLTVKVGSTTLATYSNLNHGGYVQKSFDLSAYRGQQVTVTFTGTENASRYTSFAVDDTAVSIS